MSDSSTTAGPKRRDVVTDVSTGQRRQRGVADSSEAVNVDADKTVDPMIQSLLGQLGALPRQAAVTTIEPTTAGQLSTSRATAEAANLSKRKKPKRKSEKQKAAGQQKQGDDVQKPTTTETPTFQSPTSPVHQLPGAMTLEMVESALLELDRSTGKE